MNLEAWVEILSGLAAQHVVELHLLKITAVLLEVVETFQEELVPIILKHLSTRDLVELQNLKSRHLTNQGHQPVVVGLELGLVDGWDAESLNLGSKLVNVLVHQLEVLSERQVLNHLFKAQLVEQVTPGELVSRVVLEYGFIHEVCSCEVIDS